MKKLLGMILVTVMTLALVGCSPAPGTQQASYIGADAARAIALEDAGVTDESAANFVREELDSDNGVVYYDVEFIFNGIEYDYDIDAVTGTIISSSGSQEMNNSNTAQGGQNTQNDQNTQAATQTPAAGQSNQNAQASISEDQAKNIALEKIPGATTNDIYEFKMDYDDGRLEYEGTIVYEGIEYEFKIDGYSGAIREWETERWGY